ncbi:CbrC family protein [Streptomyces albidoflavus]
MTTGSVRASEVARRTPAFSAWQYPHWPVRCRNAAAFLCEAGYPELAQRPEALAQPRSNPAPGRLAGREPAGALPDPPRPGLGHRHAPPLHGLRHRAGVRRR